MTLDKGGFLVLVGPSGCGKSTLLNTIAGLEIDHLGRDPHRRPARSTICTPRKRDIAMVFQSYALYPNMTVAENIAFGMEMRGVPKAEREKAVDARRQDAADRATCSSASRASFPAASASASPWAGRWCAIRSVFLFDEPLSNLDAKLRVDMRIEIKRLHQATGTTIVYVTHDQIEAMTLATKIAVLQGRRGAAGRHAGRDLQQPGQSLRRRLHGLAGDEPDRRQGARANGRAAIVLERNGPGSRSSLPAPPSADAEQARARAAR